MYLNFYGLREQPFGVTPDPKFLFFSTRHREALASLNYGIHTARGFIALIAKPGMGKTTLLFELLNRLRGDARTAFLFQTQCDSRELRRYLLGELGVKNVEYDLVRQQEQLHEVLRCETRMGKRVVIVIDEAQNLKPEVLETVRLLSNFETQTTKLLHIVLAGQPQLADRLAAPGLLQLRQRIAMWRKLDPLTSAEVTQYVSHRLHVAGYQGEALFDHEAQQLVAQFSQGVPRVINHLCFGALSIGFALNKRVISGEVIREVIQDQSLEEFVHDAEPHRIRTRSTVSSEAEGKKSVADANAFPREVAVAQVPIGIRASAPAALAQQIANAGGGARVPVAESAKNPTTIAGVQTVPHDQTSAQRAPAPPTMKSNVEPPTSRISSLHIETKWQEERNRMTRPLQLYRADTTTRQEQMRPVARGAETGKHQFSSVIKWLKGR